MSKFVGLVVSNKMQKSVTVKVDHFMRHPRYHRFVRTSRKFMAHDELEACTEGDQVQIEISKPISKNKAWIVTEILKKERMFDTSEYAAERAAADAVSLPIVPKPVVGFRKEYLTRGAEVQGMIWGKQLGGAVVDLGIGLPGIIRPLDDQHLSEEEKAQHWAQLESATKGEVIKVRVEGSLDAATGLARLSFVERLSSAEKRVEIADAAEREEYLLKAVARARREALTPEESKRAPTPKKAEEAKVRRFSQIGRLLVGELSEVGPDGAVVDLGRAWKGFIPAPMFAWQPPAGGSEEPSTSGQEGGEKSPKRRDAEGGFSREASRTREQLERTLYGVKLKVKVEDILPEKQQVVLSLVGRATPETQVERKMLKACNGLPWAGSEWEKTRRDLLTKHGGSISAAASEFAEGSPPQEETTKEEGKGEKNGERIQSEDKGDGGNAESR